MPTTILDNPYAAEYLAKPTARNHRRMREWAQARARTLTRSTGRRHWVIAPAASPVLLVATREQGQ